MKNDFVALYNNKSQRQSQKKMRFRLLHKYFIITVAFLICSITLIVNIIIISSLVTLNSSPSDLMNQNFPNSLLQNNKTMRSRSRYPNVHIFYYPWYANPQTDGAWNHWNHKILPHWFEKLSMMFRFSYTTTIIQSKFSDYVSF